MGFNLLKAFQGGTRPLGGRYQIVQELGSGGFGQTFLASDLHLPGHPLCVVKQLKPQVSTAAQMQVARRLFDTEAKTLYKLGSHAQIPRLLAHFEENQDFYLAQELIDGHPLSDELRPLQPWAPEQVVALLSDLLGVLAFVHQNNVIHRDIKPSNLMRRHSDGRIVLIDFGAVKQASTQLASSNTGTHTISIGTQGYMPSEQISGNPRFSSDLYAVGMIAIQALTGRHPMQLAVDPTTCELLWRDRVSNLPPELGNLLDQMVRYDFRTRFPTATDALNALNTLPEDLRNAAIAVPFIPPVPTVGTVSPDFNDPTSPWPTGLSEERSAESTPVPHRPNGALGDRTGKTVAVPPLRPSSEADAKPWMMPVAGAIAALVLGSLGLSLVMPNRNPGDGEIAVASDTPTASDAEASTVPDPNTVQSPEAETPKPQEAAIAQVEKADALRAEGRYQPALAAYEEAIALDNALPEAHWGKCYSLNKLERFAEASQACDAAIALQPGYADALWSKGYALEKQQQPQQALDFYDQAIAVDQSHAEAWNNRGTALFQLGQIDAAYDAFNQAVTLNPDFSEAWSNRAASLWEQGQYDGALQSINRAIEVDPENAIAQNLRQQMRNKLGR